ncbi:MAG: hypothetical protein REI78_13100 [Pedobacter sp.]|nr:hypothetical protein [Pedobacter sp.]MDQ8053964.1 hypothetical protein [Pedobacter sp.]
MKYLQLIPILLLMLTTLGTQANTGCRSSSTTYTYINPEGRLRNGVPSYYHRYESDRLLSTSTYCVVDTDSPCYIYATRSGYSSSPGELVEYNPVNNCDIDSYVAVMVVICSGMGFMMLKRKSHIFSID